MFVFTSVLQTLRASVHRLHRAWVYFFSTRRKLVILYPNKLEISRYAHSLAAVNPRHIHVCRRCIKRILSHTQQVRAAHTEKTHPTPVCVHLIFESRIFNVYFYFRHSVPLTIRPSVSRFLPIEFIPLLYYNKHYNG